MVAVMAHAKVKPAQVFTSDMVLQQGKVLTIWGTADKGEKVTVKLAGQTVKTTADDNGNWSVKVNALKASSKPVKFAISGRKNKVVLSNVLVGEVWLAGGQSNMEYSMGNHPNYIRPKKGDPERLQHELEKADNPMIRLLYIRKDLKQDSLPTDGWKTISYESLKPFSANQAKTPLIIRFGWDEIGQPNLINSAGLPAAAFEWKSK